MIIVILISLILFTMVTRSVEQSENKIIQIFPDIGDGCGTLEITVLCHHNLFSKEMSIERVDDSNTMTFLNGERISQEKFNKYQKVGSPALLTLDPAGSFDGRFAEGVYAVKLFDGNGGQPEYSLISVSKGYSSNIFFVGHAISGTGTPVPTGTGTPVPTGTGTPVPTGTGTPVPTGTGTPVPTGTGTPVPTGTGTPVPTGTGTPVPTPSCTPDPTHCYWEFYSICIIRM